MLNVKPTVYRVRKNFNDIKSQTGAYFILENAIKKATQTKCNVYDGDKNCVWRFNKTYKENLL